MQPTNDQPEVPDEHSILLDNVKQEFIDNAAKAVALKNDIDAAQTNTKKKYLRKKLLKVNTYSAQLLNFVDKYSNLKK